MISQQQNCRTIGHSSYRSNAFEPPEYWARDYYDEDDSTEAQHRHEMMLAGLRCSVLQERIKTLEEELAWAKFEIERMKNPQWILEEQKGRS